MPFSSNTADAIDSGFLIPRRHVDAVYRFTLISHRLIDAVYRVTLVSYRLIDAVHRAFSDFPKVSTMLSGGVQDPAEYFRPPGGLLSFDMHLHDLLDRAAPHPQVLHSVNNSQAEPRQRTMKLDEDKMGHFDLANAQIQQVAHSGIIQYYNMAYSRH